uniref:Uncharacterized protein n=1 Tax=Oryza barthii TaxID=65489 RepID=A0A0D3HM63_9ORYZ
MATSETAAAPQRGGKRPPPTGGGRDSAGRGRGMGSCDAGGERGEGAASPVGIKGSDAAMGEVAAPPWGEGREQGLGISAAADARPKTRLGFHPERERVYEATPPRRKRHPQASMLPNLEDQAELSPKTPSRVRNLQETRARVLSVMVAQLIG